MKLDHSFMKEFKMNKKYLKNRIVWIFCKEVGYQISRFLRKTILGKKK